MVLGCLGAIRVNYGLFAWCRSTSGEWSEDGVPVTQVGDCFLNAKITICVCNAQLYRGSAHFR